MKTTLHVSYTLLASVFIGWLSAGCNHSSSDANPQSSCRIEQYTSNASSKFYTTVMQNTYTYDLSGNLAKVVSTIERKPTTGTIGTQNGTTTETYTYNADGYLTAMNSERQTKSIGVNNQSTTELLSIVKSYSYTAGRLVSVAQTYKGSYTGSNSSSTMRYEYDSDGDLTRIINEPTGGNGYQQIIVYRKNQLVDYIEKTSSGDQHPYTIQDGLVTKMVFSGTNELIISTSFDGKNRVIKRDQVIDGQLNQTDTQTWTDAKSASSSLPLFKGFPTPDPDTIFSGQAGVTATQNTSFWNSVSKTMQPYSQSTSTAQTNAQGYVTNVTKVINYPSASDQNETTTETYTYLGCQ